MEGEVVWIDQERTNIFTKNTGKIQDTDAIERSWQGLGISLSSTGTVCLAALMRLGQE